MGQRNLGKFVIIKPNQTNKQTKKTEQKSTAIFLYPSQNKQTRKLWALIWRTNFKIPIWSNITLILSASKCYTIGQHTITYIVLLPKLFLLCISFLLLCTNPQNLAAWKNNSNLLAVSVSVHQEFRQTTARTAHLYSTTSRASAETESSDGHSLIHVAVNWDLS